MSGSGVTKGAPRATRVHVITMGCAKNVVDSEKLISPRKLYVAMIKAAGRAAGTSS